MGSLIIIVVNIFSSKDNDVVNLCKFEYIIQNFRNSLMQGNKMNQKL